jgi:hypothetical protein
MARKFSLPDVPPRTIIECICRRQHLVIGELDEISLKIPAACGIEAMPRGGKTPKSLVGFELVVGKAGPAIHIRRLLEVDGYSFPVTAYPSLRTFFETVASADEQQIVMESAHSSAP